MSLKRWFRDLGPNRKVANKVITRIAAVSLPVFGEQIQTHFETTFEELEDCEGSDQLYELSSLVNQRFDVLITQIESRQWSNERRRELFWAFET